VGVVGTSISRLTGRPRLPVFGGGSGGLTYPQFVASVTAKAPTSGTWNAGANQTTGDYRVTCAAPDPGRLMYGSPWNSVYFAQSGASDLCRIIQHCFPDQTTFDENVASGRQVFFRVNRGGATQTAFTALNRNGYLSQNYDDGSPYQIGQITLFAWWNSALGKAQQANPSIGGAPVDYVP